jgi:hypothetical protein
MWHIENTNTQARYDLTLPKVINIDEMDNNSTLEERSTKAQREGIPMSGIAKKLDFKLQSHFEKCQKLQKLQFTYNQTHAHNNINIIPKNDRTSITRTVISPTSSAFKVAITMLKTGNVSSSNILRNINHNNDKSITINIDDSLLSRQVDMLTIDLANDIMDCFHSLFNKYVSNTSKYCVNIQSSTRSVLTSMYDEKFYKIWQLKLETEKDNGNYKGKGHFRKKSLSYTATFSSADVTLWDRIKFEAASGNHKKSFIYNNAMAEYINNAPSISLQTSINTAEPSMPSTNNNTGISIDNESTGVAGGGGGDSDIELDEKSNARKDNQDEDADEDDNVCRNELNLIKAKFGEYVQDNGKNLKEKELIEWLLNQLIQHMEDAVVEVSVLMNDSFSRFKKEETIYEKACNLAEKQHENNSRVSSNAASPVPIMNVSPLPSS